MKSESIYYTDEDLHFEVHPYFNGNSVDLSEVTAEACAYVKGGETVPVELYRSDSYYDAVISCEYLSKVPSGILNLKIKYTYEGCNYYNTVQLVPVITRNCNNEYYGNYED